MLLTLSIRNVVLIERLEISFKPGLCVLTGETGAGNCIITQIRARRLFVKYSG